MNWIDRPRIFRGNVDRHLAPTPINGDTFTATLEDGFAVTVSGPSFHNFPFSPAETPEDTAQKDYDLSHAAWTQVYQAAFAEVADAAELRLELSRNTYQPQFPDAMGGGIGTLWEVLQVVLPRGAEAVAYDVMIDLIGDWLTEVVARMRELMNAAGTPIKGRTLPNHHPRVVRSACEAHARRTYPTRAPKLGQMIAPAQLPDDYGIDPAMLTMWVPTDVGGLIYVVSSRLHIETIWGSHRGRLQRLNTESWNRLYAPT